MLAKHASDFRSENRTSHRPLFLVASFVERQRQCTTATRLTVTTRKESWVSNTQFSPNSTCFRSLHSFFCIAAFFVTLIGCGTSGQQLTQLRNENDRLLNEYRAQRDQVAQLNEKLAVTQARLAESEKLLARQSPPTPSTRVSRLNEPGSLPSSAPSFGSLSRGTAVRPNNGGTESSAAAKNPVEPSIPAAELNWRPIRRGSPQ